MNKPLLIVVALLACARFADAQAFVINAPGTYVLSSDLSDPGTVVQINSSNVTLQMNGKTLTCTPQSGQTGITYGIYAGNLHDVRVLGPGNIRNCYMGAQMAYGSNHLVQGLDVSQQRYIGLNLAFGFGNIVRDIDCSAIGGFYPSAYAICVNGIGVNGLIERVRINEIYRQAISPEVGEGVGVLVDWGASGVRLRDIVMINQTVQANTICTWVAGGGASVEAEAITCLGFTDVKRGEGVYTAVGPVEPTPPLPPAPPSPGASQKYYYICDGTPLVCWQGMLAKVP